MKKFCYNLKTSDKITFLFSVFNFVGLLLLLLVINITYFFIWYSAQKEESWYDMNKNYTEIVGGNKNNVEAFKEYILKKDTLIIPNDGGDFICSNGVETKIHNNIDSIKDDLFYNNGEKIFFIYTKVYPEIGEVKVFFDTTSYVKSQIIIIKISLFLILFSLFVFYFIGKKITKYSFKNLEKIAKKAGELDIEKDFKKLKIVGNNDDEINVLATKINDSFCHIKNQTSNLKQFITDVSHEFKTPLMVINSKIDLYNKKIEKNKLVSGDTEILLENIKDKTKKLDNLLETFLFLSRLENNIEKLNNKKVNIGDYLENFTKNYLENNNDILEKNLLENIEIKYNFKKNLYIEIEENTFNILFGNLLSNAIKFSKNNLEKNKKIEIKIGANKKSFWILDNGVGINKNDLNNIWDKFFRNDRNIEGFGIGLFLVKRLSDLYDWNIEVESEENMGTKFVIKYI